jgi:hypothetical protein
VPTACTDTTGPVVSSAASTAATTDTPVSLPAPTAPAGTPTSADARAALERLVVAEPGELPAFDVEAFGGYTDTDGNGCNQRIDTLGQWTRLPSTVACQITGTILEPYSGQVLRVAQEMNLDHVVSLEDAWASGAHAWDNDRRSAWFNDGGNLVPTTTEQMESKRGASIATWLPAAPAAHCAYARVYVATKSTWRLTVTQAEHDALESILDGCPVPPGSPSTPPATTATVPPPTPTT